MTFTTEAQFEQAFIDVLTHKGWESQILKNKTEAELLQNWANILFETSHARFEVAKSSYQEQQNMQVAIHHKPANSKLE